MAQIAEAALRAEADEEEAPAQCPVAPFTRGPGPPTTYRVADKRLPSDPTFELPAEVAETCGKKPRRLHRPAAAEDWLKGPLPHRGRGEAPIMEVGDLASVRFLFGAAAVC